MTTKKEIRLEMLLKRKSMSDLEKKRQTQSIIDQIQKMETYQTAKTVSIFYPMANEIDLRKLRDDHKEILLPRIDNNKMVFHIWTKETKFKTSSFGVAEPISGSIFEDRIDFMLVPALAISQDCFRIGYGRGYYDQYINNNRPKLTVGVIYDFQEVESLPTEPHDQKLDLYVKGSL
ncbi:MAG: 5-formyltetrahydrofolate cyclo-ligase [Acholeplasmataceae bacterium]